MKRTCCILLRSTYVNCIFKDLLSMHLCNILYVSTYCILLLLICMAKKGEKVISSIQIINIPFSARRTLGIWAWWGRNRSQSIGTFRNIGGGIQIQKSKIYFEVALKIECRNMPWSQCFNQNLISRTGWTTLGTAIMVQAALDTRAANTTMAGPKVVQPLNFWLKHCDQNIFLHPILSATSFK